MSKSFKHYMLKLFFTPIGREIPSLFYSKALYKQRNARYFMTYEEKATHENRTV